MRRPLERLAVVVPARNEERLLPDCLAALGEAAAHLHSQRPSIAVSVTVVLDRTTDGSAAVVRRYPLASALHSEAGKVGAARNAGIRNVLRRGAPAVIWIANTDADSMVPRNWLLVQAEAAARGWDVLAGTVQPDTSELTQEQSVRWFGSHNLREGHGHIHGANLGFRADAYLRLGGFDDVTLHEDRNFVLAAAAAGLRIRSTDAGRVRTSARTHSRVHGGFADYLAREVVAPALDSQATGKVTADTQA
ncbi:glycosyltransferase [Paeniglutamicibacter antarcticus]|uniref:4,4'-diaponeurosporenoate glycosyltransferase n=1 Tax=Arthrobacter terrae TaxID=2935737 RepID=A0A931CNW1_9MICC|nr:glycosyltransferase [Arthrobacter terrae]MBG0739950.1 glycosyltransferase [Arthrobacter terrae]